MNPSFSSPDDGFGISFHPKKEEKLPLTHPATRGSVSLCSSQYGRTFDAIVFCMVLFTISVTVALIVHIVVYDYQEPRGPQRRQGALVTESRECGAIGVEILKEGGSAVDAAIAVQICSAVILPHLTGIGGGGLMIIYQNGGHEESKTIDFQETSQATKQDFVNSSKLPVDQNVPRIAIPGFLSGLGLAHGLYGKLPWRRLVEPAVTLAAEGFHIGDSLYSAIQQYQQRILAQKLFKEVFAPNGTIPRVGDWIRWKTLADTLAVIAKEGPDVFYNGSLVNVTVQELTEAGATLTAEDLGSFSAKLLPPLELSYQGLQLLTPPSTSAGLSFLLIVKLIEALQVSHKTSESTGPQYDMLIQAIKVASATVDPLWPFNWTADGLLGEEGIKKLIKDYFDNDQNVSISFTEPLGIPPPTAAASVIVSDSDDLLVAAVSGLGSPFGSGIITTSGIIWNDAYKPGCNEQVCHLSSTVLPIILGEKGNPCGIHLAAVSADYQMLAQVIAQLDLSLPAKSAVSRPRLRVVLDEVLGHVRIAVNNDSQWNAALLDDFRQQGNDIFQTKDFFSSVAVLRTLEDTMEVYTDSKPEGVQMVL